jgi:predicted deacylase
LEGGNHGDEYEGPIVVGELIRTLDPGAVSGRLIFIPAVNLPAVAAARRTSRFDDLNFNRAFPGDPLGSPAQQIAAYVNDVLFPMADAFLDLHSGGSSLAIIPSAIIEPIANPERHARHKAATLAFGAPMTVAIDNRGDPRNATASTARAGLTVVGTELAGAGTVTIDALAVCRRGVHNVLAHLGALPPKMADPPKTASPVYELPGPNAYGPGDEGVFDPIHANATAVCDGQPAGRVHFRRSKPPAGRTRLPGQRRPLRAAAAGQSEAGELCRVVARPLDAA